MLITDLAHCDMIGCDAKYCVESARRPRVMHYQIVQWRRRQDARFLKSSEGFYGSAVKVWSLASNNSLKIVQSHTYDQDHTQTWQTQPT